MLSKNRIKYLRSLELKKKRKEEGVFVAEGTKMVGELIGHMQCVYAATTDDGLQRVPALKHMVAKNLCPVDIVTDDELRRISFLDTPQDVLALFRQPDHNVSMAHVASDSLCLALDGVQNPGNLGTIVRIADWFGIEHIFCSPACADIFNPKTVQATMGAIARVSVHYCKLEQELTSLSPSVPVYGTFLDGDNIYAKQLATHGVIIMGNEGRGISPEVEASVTQRLLIPNYPQGRPTSESLNVAIATSIVCAEFRRQMM